MIRYLCLKGLSPKEVNEDMVATLGEGDEDIIAAVDHFLKVQDADFDNGGICMLHNCFSKIYSFYLSQ